MLMVLIKRGFFGDIAHSEEGGNSAWKIGNFVELLTEFPPASELTKKKEHFTTNYLFAIACSTSVIVTSKLSPLKPKAIAIDSRPLGYLSEVLTTKPFSKI